MFADTITVNMVVGKKRAGFTIVELLIVIVVIGILAALVMSVYSNAQLRARAAGAADGIKKIEKGLTLLATDQGRSTWWTEAEFGQGGNPLVTTLVSATDLKKYLQSAPSVPGMEGARWLYDNDGDQRTDACAANVVQGVNIGFEVVDAAFVSEVDKMIDDGDPNCGRVRLYGGTQLQYSISTVQQIR